MSVLNPPGVTTTLSSTATGQAATYEFGTYSTADTNRQLHQFVYTFPAGTDLSRATLTSHPGTVARSGTTLTVTFSPRIPHGTASFTIVIAGVINGAAGTYTGQTAQFRTTNPGGQQAQTDTLAIGNYTIHAEPHLSMSVSPGQLNFDLTPDAPSPGQHVTVTVVSSHAYTITRDIGGDAALFGLAVSGQATGAKPAGSATFVDTYSAQVPWTTEGDRTYTATVTYTVVR